MLKPVDLLKAFCFCGVIAIGAGAVTAAYPERPVHFVVGVMPGASTDFVGRLMGAKLSEKWGQPVLVENRGGADGMIAEEYVAHSPPDGYTIDIPHEGHDVNPARGEKMAYDAVNGFEPIIRLTNTPLVLVVNPQKIKANTFDELISYIKANPGKVTYGHGGVGVAPNIIMLHLMSDLHFTATPIQFSGMAPAMVSILGGEIDLMWGSVVLVEPQIKSGKLKALAVSTGTRWPSLPDVPTAAEVAKIPGFDVGSWAGMLAPAGTPKEIVAKIHDDSAAILEQPDVKKNMADHGFEIIGGSSKDFVDYIAKDMAEMRVLFKNVK